MTISNVIGALLATHDASALKTRERKLVAKGTPVDAERMVRFEILAARLRAEPLPQRAAVATNEPARSYFAVLEAYFSNYVEGTEFAIEEAREIQRMGGRGGAMERCFPFPRLLNAAGKG